MASRRCRQAAVLVAVLCGLWPSAALAAPGDLDTTFGGGDGKVTADFGSGEDSASGAALQPDGKLLVAGSDSDDEEFILARYLPNGALDTSFGGGDGIASTDLLSYGEIALVPDGSIMVGGGNGDFILARFTSAGVLDTSFSGDGIVQADLGGSTDYAYDILRQDDGKLVLCGQGGMADDFALMRFSPDGTLDTSFGGGDGKVTTQFGEDVSGLEDIASALAIAPDGKIVAAGGTSVGGTPGDEYDLALARYNPDGSLDSGFAGDGTTTLGFEGFESAGAVAVQPNGKVIMGGSGDLAGKSHFTLARYLTNGTLDPGFGGGDGIVMHDLGPFGSGVSSLVLQADGRIVAGGSGGDSAEDFLVVRFNPSGSFDTTFGDGDGWVTANFKNDSDWVHALVLQPDGKIVAVGTARNLGTFDDEFAIARFVGGGAPPSETEDPGQPPEESPSPPPTGDGSTPPSPFSNTIVEAPTPSTHAKRLKCKKGFKKRKVRGKTRCVKKQRKTRRRATASAAKAPKQIVYPVKITIKLKSTVFPPGSPWEETGAPAVAFVGQITSPKAACKRNRPIISIAASPPKFIPEEDRYTGVVSSSTGAYEDEPFPDVGYSESIRRGERRQQVKVARKALGGRRFCAEATSARLKA